MTQPPAGYVPLAAFFPIKVLTSSLVLYAIYTDTGPRMILSPSPSEALDVRSDVLLAMSFFGLVTCWNTRQAPQETSIPTLLSSSWWSG
jgi:hypothetical protein